MTLLSRNLRLTAAYVFEKRNCFTGSCHDDQLDLFYYRDPGFKVRKFSPAVGDHLNLLMLPLPTHSGQDLQALRNFALFGNASSRK